MRLRPWKRKNITKNSIITTPMKVQDARPGAAAEEHGEREQRRVEQGQPREREQDEADARDPVAGPPEAV